MRLTPWLMLVSGLFFEEILPASMNVDSVLLEYFTIDQNLETCAELDEEEVTQMVTIKHAGSEGDVKEQDVRDQEVPMPSQADVMQSLDILQNFLIHCDGSNAHQQSFIYLCSFADKVITSSLRQSVLSEYFDSSVLILQVVYQTLFT